jgi:hypothetical protein
MLSTIFTCPRCRRDDDSYLHIVSGKPYVTCYSCYIRWPADRRATLMMTTVRRPDDVMPDDTTDLDDND